jgi:hypothetical protein
MRKKRMHILLGHTDEHIKAYCNQVPLFEPHDLRSLTSEARASGGASEREKAFLMAIKERNQVQIIDLFRQLDIDPSRSDAWQRGFLRLACRHYGVGRLALHHIRTNRNAVTWAPVDDLRLLEEVTKAMTSGKSERQAIKQIIANPKTRRLFPYGEKNRTKSYYSVQNERQKQESALRRRLQRLKKSSNEKSILDQLLGSGWDAQGVFERVLYAVDLTALLPGRVVTNKRARR